ncbi:radical SAM protein [Chloroflexota bacterium]
MEAKSSSRDYIFRYQVGLDNEPEHTCRDRLVEMIRAQLEHILNLAVAIHGEKELKVDGFKLLSDTSTVYKVFSSEGEPRDEDYTDRASNLKGDSFQDIGNACLFEPRIEFIKKQLESLLSVVALEKDGEVVKVDSFRLKNLNDWLVPSNCSPTEIFGYAGTRCDVDCGFCYHKGNPPSLALGHRKRSANEELEEIMTRLSYFNPRAGVSLFPSLGIIQEVLMHPDIFGVLRLLREKTSRILKITTNGSVLTPSAITSLASLQPIYLYLSLNSASPLRRTKLMKGTKSDIALNALPLLREKKIPYAVVIVAWPDGSLGELLDDLATTVAYADAYDPNIIEVHLPGYSKYFSSKELFDSDEVWSAIVSQIRKLRENTITPIVVMPSLWEENLYEEQKNLPKIIGLVKNSPAANADLKRGDQILEINGIHISTRPQARDTLSILAGSNSQEASLTVKRDNRILPVSLNLTSFSYPYSNVTDNQLGIIMGGAGFRLSYVERLKELIDSHGAKHVLFLSSTLVKPGFQQALAESHLFDNSELILDIEIPRNNFFGGNIFMGDLLVVQDFVDCIREYLGKQAAKPDLVIIPSSPFNLGGWKRDLTGRVYLDIERKTGIPVALLDCETIYD